MTDVIKHLKFETYFFALEIHLADRFNTESQTIRNIGNLRSQLKRPNEDLTDHQIDNLRSDNQTFGPHWKVGKMGDYINGSEQIMRRQVLLNLLDYLREQIGSRSEISTDVLHSENLGFYRLQISGIDLDETQSAEEFFQIFSFS